MKDASWYWHRLRAMSPGEMWGHARKKWRQRVDRSRSLALPPTFPPPSGGFPALPPRESAPPEFLQELRSEVREILAGRWRAFGHLTLQVDDPPRWHKDYLVGVDLATQESAFGLNHRALPQGADVKLIWELSRWYSLMRLAQASYLLGDEQAAMKCVEWMEDWVEKNPPRIGWNWTSALEVGMRLIQFTWMDALLDRSSDGIKKRWAALRGPVLVPHISYAWRYKSFGSSANNHLLGELVGLILATVRWPELARWGASLDELQNVWEHEVLEQFAEDGGNREQALNYQLFSFEFCWQARLALVAGGRSVSSKVETRLSNAARFFWEVQVRQEPWDYGDSDSAYVSPLFVRDRAVVAEWAGWMDQTPVGNTVRFWLGAPPEFGAPLGRGTAPGHCRQVGDWWIYPQTGIGIHGSGLWWLRWDLSPLGYLSTAAHGHLDALHLSIWLKGTAFVVDPGTGAYYADATLRAWLASRDAHNGPKPSHLAEYPRRMGPFLWATAHEFPRYEADRSGTEGVYTIPGCEMKRRISSAASGNEWSIQDRCVDAHGQGVPFTVRWQFAPATVIRRRDARSFTLCRQGLSLEVRVSAEWESVEMVERGDPGHSDSGKSSLAGIVSPAFRKTEYAPFLLLAARPKGDNSCVFTTTFLASDAS